MIEPRPEVRVMPIAEHGGRRALGGRGERLIDFSVCLNAYGPAPAVVDAIRSASVDEYPDPRATVAREAFAHSWSLSPSSVVIGAGAAELIQAVSFAYLRAGDTALVVEPSFGEYRRAAALCGAQVAGVPLVAGDDPLTLVRAAIDVHRPRLVFLASPVNPSGVALTRDELSCVADACASVGSLLVLDQAYDAFAATPLGTPALAGHSHVLHLRSLTKEHALAGVRVAVGVGPAEVVADVEAVRVPWTTSTAALAGAIATLGDDARRHAAESIASLRAARARIETALQTSGIRTHPSQTHYLLVACPNATMVRDTLIAKRGILVRDCTSFGLPGHVRVAARLPRENDALIHALRDLLQ